MLFCIVSACYQGCRVGGKISDCRFRVSKIPDTDSWLWVFFHMQPWRHRLSETTSSLGILPFSSSYEFYSECLGGNRTSPFPKLSGVGGGGCRGYKRIPKSFDLSKIWAKLLKILAKSLKIWANNLSRENHWKSRQKSCPTLFVFKNGAQHLQKNKWRSFFGSHTKNGLHDLCGRKFVGKSCTKTFRANLGEIRAKILRTLKICLLLHLCLTWLLSMQEKVDEMWRRCDYPWRFGSSSNMKLSKNIIQQITTKTSNEKRAFTKRCNFAIFLFPAWSAHAQLEILSKDRTSSRIRGFAHKFTLTFHLT